MADRVVDPASFVGGRERADGPLIPVVGSMTFPGMDDAARELTCVLAEIAFDAVRFAGGRPRLVDSAAPESFPIQEVLAQAQGIVFLGGGDVDGACYGYDGPPPPNEYGVDRAADDFCIALIREAVTRNVPLLALCRGSQLFNVAFGGTLIPDIAEFAMHRGGAGEPLFVDETVILEEGSLIAGILGRTRVTVRNGHHQAVDRVAPALRATAHAQDGIVEGTEHREATWAMGIQWHPEESEADEADRQAIFGALMAQAARRTV